MKEKVDKRQTSAPRRKTKRLVVSPSRTMIIYDYDKSGKEIVRQETIHEYKERVAVFVKCRKKARSISKPNPQWDMTKCRKKCELNKIIKDAWSNIVDGKLKDGVQEVPVSKVEK